MATLISNQLKINFITALLFRFIVNQELYMKSQTMESRKMKHSSWKLNLFRKKDLRDVDGKLHRNGVIKTFAHFFLQVDYNIDIQFMACNWILFFVSAKCDDNLIEKLKTIFEIPGKNVEEYVFSSFRFFKSDVIHIERSKRPLFLSKQDLTNLKTPFYRAAELFRNDSEYEWVLTNSEYAKPPTNTLSPLSSNFCTALHSFASRISTKGLSPENQKRLSKVAQVTSDFHLHATAANQMIFAKYFSQFCCSESDSRLIINHVTDAFNQLMKRTNNNMKMFDSLPHVIIDIIQNSNHPFRVNSLQARLNDILDDASLSNAFIIAATTHPPITTPFTDFGHFHSSPASDWKNACFYPINGDGKYKPNPLIKHKFINSSNFSNHQDLETFVQFNEFIAMISYLYNTHFSTGVGEKEIK